MADEVVRLVGHLRDEIEQAALLARVRDRVRVRIRVRGSVRVRVRVRVG